MGVHDGPEYARPVYHQKTHRVEGHIFITLLAYNLVHQIRCKLKAQDIHDSWDTLRTTMSTQVRVTTSLRGETGNTTPGLRHGLIGIEIEAVNTLDIHSDLFFQQFTQVLFYHDLGPSWQFGCFTLSPLVRL